MSQEEQQNPEDSGQMAVVNIDTLELCNASTERLGVLLKVWVVAAGKKLSDEDSIVMDALRHRLKMMLNDDSVDVLMRAEAYVIAKGFEDESGEHET